MRLLVTCFSCLCSPRVALLPQKNTDIHSSISWHGVNVAPVWIMELFSTMMAFCYAIFDVPCALSFEFPTGLLWFSTQIGIRRCVSYTEREKFREIEILFHQLLLLNFYADFFKYLIWITSSILNCVFQLSLNYEFLCICERLGRNADWTKCRCK